MQTRRFFFVFLVFLGNTAVADTLSGYVFKVHDGDTIWVMHSSDKRYKIRLAGIDTPEAK